MNKLLSQFYVFLSEQGVIHEDKMNDKDLEFYCSQFIDGQDVKPNGQIALFGSSPNKKTLFRNSAFQNEELFYQQFQQKEFKGIDLSYYYNSILDWSNISTKKRDAKGWISTARTWMRNDKEKGKLVMVKTDPEANTQEMLNFLSRK